jgi:hypothetical protein
MEDPHLATGQPGQWTGPNVAMNVAMVAFRICMLRTFKLLDYPPKHACCLSAMTYRSLFLERNDGGQEDPGGEGMVPVAIDAGIFYGYTLSRQRLRIFCMPPAATIKTDVLKDSGTGNQVNAGLRPKATLAFLAALKVFSVFLSHKS